MQYSEVQSIAKQTIEFIKDKIYAGMTLSEIRKLCEAKMQELGADSFWYWDVGAFVFAGDETTLSVSGREYTTSERVIAENDIITIDLSPQNGDTWGDYARTVIVENGKVVTPQTTFEELYDYINGMILEKGYRNLDFLGNLGHSIERQKNDRVYIEKGNQMSLGEVAYFTFEPHISLSDSKYGYKMENIYYFENGVVKEL